MEVKSTSNSSTQSVQSTRRLEDAKEARAQQARAQNQRTENTTENSPKPVVNTQGQQTGRLLNVTA